MANKVNVGIIGLGWPGREHLKGYKQSSRARVVALCDISEERVRAAAEGVEVRARELARAVEAHLADDPATRWVLECAGGLLVPLNTRETQADVLCALNLPLVLVARSGLGTLNHTLLTLEEAARRGLRVRALFLVGPRHTANAATLRARLELPIVEREWLEPLTPDALDAWLDANPLERDAWTT